MKISLREAAGGNAVTGCWGVEGKPPRRVSRPAGPAQLFTWIENWVRRHRPDPAAWI